MPEQSGNDDLLGVLIETSRRLTDLMQHLHDNWPPLLWEEVIRSPSELIARSLITRQREALSGAVSLADMGLGHTALPSVRTACDELLWARYLSQLDEHVRTELLLTLGALEAAQAVNAQQQHIGRVAMKRLGFTRGFVRHADAQRRVAESRLAALSRRLGWPVESEHTWPAMSWLARTVDEQSLYQFLYAATSKAVHFSASEHMRRGWGNSGQPVEVGASPYVQYRSTFVLHWLASLLIETTAAVDDMVPRLASGVSDDWALDVLEVAKRLGSAGRVPIITPSEIALPDTRGFNDNLQ